MSMEDDVDKEAMLEELEWGPHLQIDKSKTNSNPTGAYNKLSEALRQNFPHEATCSMFCGGTKCKYCFIDNWKKDEQAIKGVYSHWITENILAMSRPIQEYVDKHDIIGQFKRAGIRAIINTQLPGEHVSCGNGLINNEFSYNQEKFMSERIFFYNFGWKDFGVAESMSSLLDMTNVMQFAVSDGKIAVHCHAGKGRTGVLIACFLVFNNRMTANEAVHYVRSKRPKSVQTQPQVRCVQEFEKYLRPFRVIYSTKSNLAMFNLNQYLSRQRCVLHGYSGRKLKFLPKVIFVICETLLKLAKKGELIHIPRHEKFQPIDDSGPMLRLGETYKLEKPAGRSETSTETDIDEKIMNSDSRHEHRESINGIHGAGVPTKEVRHIAEALIGDQYPDDIREKIDAHKENLNLKNSAWDELREEKNAVVLSALLWEWLDELKDPVIRHQDFHILLENIEQPQEALKKLEKGVRMTLTYLLEFAVQLQPISEELECKFIQTLLRNLTQDNNETIQLFDTISNVAVLNQSIERSPTEELDHRMDLFRFFYNLLEVVEDEMEKKNKKEK